MTALDGVARCTVTINSLKRDLDDGYGFIQTPVDSVCTFDATVMPISLAELKNSPDGSVQVDDLIIFKEGKITVAVDDEAIIDSITYVVKAARYRVEGDFTKIRVRELERANATN